jgi:DmsE family decaheme c-type cytochrome
MEHVFTIKRRLVVSALSVIAGGGLLLLAHPAARSSENPITSEVCLERHVDDPDANKPVNPARLSADSLKAVCTTCHENPHALNLFERDPHDVAGLACTACHQIHQNKYAYQLKEDQKDLCFSCHPGVRREFAMTSHHPVMDGVVDCMDCHTNVAQSPKQHKPSGAGGVCVTCHAEFQGPFPFEHPATVDYSTEEGGCLNCHAPHGSQYPRLLKESYGPPHFSLCSQCHSVPKHLNNMKHGTQWAGVPCNECHSDIHGSYTHRNLLDPSLESQGCLKAGCHKV